MGTRCLTVLEGEKDREIAVLYRQFDGYPSGHGEELVELLRGKRLVNGIGQDDTAENSFNGMNEAAARIVSYFKGSEIGGFYLYPAGTRDIGEEYIYTVTSADNASRLHLRCERTYGKGKMIFDGPPESWDLAAIEASEED